MEADHGLIQLTRAGAFRAYFAAVEKADASAVRTLLDDQFVIISSTVRNMAEEIDDLVSDGRQAWRRMEDPGPAIPLFLACRWTAIAVPRWALRRPGG